MLKKRFHNHHNKQTQNRNPNKPKTQPPSKAVHPKRSNNNQKENSKSIAISAELNKKEEKGEMVKL
jgi:hypothetical protein